MDMFTKTIGEFAIKSIRIFYTKNNEKEDFRRLNEGLKNYTHGISPSCKRLFQSFSQFIIFSCQEPQLSCDTFYHQVFANIQVSYGALQ